MRNSPSIGTGRHLLGLAGLACSLCPSAYAQEFKSVFVTQDYTASTLEGPFREAWVDTKTPGGMPMFLPSGGGVVADTRRTYVVGTIEVQTTVTGAEFSGEDASPSSGTGFSLTGQNRRQVVVLQCNLTHFGTVGGTPAPNQILWQRYFYGESGTTQNPDTTRATNARAISVWMAEDPADVRIAICGETYDARIPLSQSPTVGWTAASASHPSGYIAVYDGDGFLLWTRHFFAGSESDVDCAVTDVSIRVDDEGIEYVTYCGISSHGNPGSGTLLTPEKEFASPGTGLTSGSTTQSPGQWDGFVGRLVRTGSTITQPFHSMVSSGGQDGLFGLAEITEDRFAVVGATRAADGSEDDFPIADGGFQVLGPPYYVGVALVFDASAVPGGNLVLATSQGLGRQTSDLHTIARDISVGWDVKGQTPDITPMLYVVGSTDDDSLQPTTPSPVWLVTGSNGQQTFRGGTDGFIAVLSDEAATPLLRAQTFAYWGGEGDDGLTGVNGWNEFGEHIGVVGFTTPGEAASDIGVSTYFFNNAYGHDNSLSGNTSPVNASYELLRIRDAVLGGAGTDYPTMIGAQNATDDVAGTSPSLLFDTEGLGFTPGGGIAVGNDGRINAVGRTGSPGITPVGGGRAYDAGLDAVRGELDLLPASPTSLPGVARTDGTGFQGSGANFPLVGYWGGTTPTCGLAPYGRRIGEPVPLLARMMIDYEGAAPAGGVSDTAIIVSRPTNYPGSFPIGAFWFTLPITTGFPIFDEVEFWVNTGVGVLVGATWAPGQCYRARIDPNPSTTGITVSAQLYCLLDLSAGSGFAGFNQVSFGSGCVSAWTASPALWFSY